MEEEEEEEEGGVGKSSTALSIPYISSHTYFILPARTAASHLRCRAFCVSVRLCSLPCLSFSFTCIHVDFYRQLYPSVKRSILLDDSGPILDDQAIPVCLQENWRQTWNLNASMPKDCPCLGNKGNIVAMWAYGQKKYPQDSLALISSLSDAGKYLT